MNTKDKPEILCECIKDDFKLLNARYSYQDNTLKLNILISKNATVQNSNSIVSSLKKLLGLDIEIDINLIQAKNENDLEKDLNDILQKHILDEINLLKEVNITLKDDSKFLNVILNKKQLDDQDMQPLKNEINEYLDQSFIEKYFLSINLISSESEAKDILIQRDDILKQDIPNFEEVVDLNFDVTNVQLVFGKNLYHNAKKIKFVKNQAENVQIAGKIIFFRENTYKPKNSGDSEEEKIRYNFDIQDSTGKISAVIFPTKAFLEREDIKLENNQEIIVNGDVSKYNDKLSIKIKELCFCELPDMLKDENVKQNEIVNIDFIKDVADEYALIKPKEYVELEQINLFKGQSLVTKSLLENEYVIFDLETTGFEPEYCEIIEIGAVKVRKGEIIETFNTLIRPSRSIPEEITKITHITDDMVVFAPVLSEVLPDFYKFTRGCTMVAHNAKFDIPFLKYHSEKLRYDFDNNVEDTLVMARNLIKGLKNYKLKTLSDYFEIVLVDAHRALNDTLATAKLFIELKKIEDKKME